MSAVWEDNLEFIDTAEVHWSTGTILAIFFASALVSAVFFGLGYSFGRGGASQGGAGSSLAASVQSLTGQTQMADVPAAPSGSSAPVQARTAVSHPATAGVAVARTSSRAAQVALIPADGPVATTKAKTQKAVGAPVHYMVQVGAIGSQKDARKLVAELRKRGIHARIYSSRTDRFLHVQVGPYTTTEQAQAMRHRVRASGFPAVLKRAS